MLFNVKYFHLSMLIYKALYEIFFLYGNPPCRLKRLARLIQYLISSILMTRPLLIFFQYYKIDYKNNTMILRH